MPRVDLVTVALANTGLPSRWRDGVPQTARIVWALLVKGGVYRAPVVMA